MLSAIIFLPAIGGIFVLLFLNRDAKRIIGGVAFTFSFLSLLCSLMMFSKFDFAIKGFQFTELFSWIKDWNIQYHLGADSLSYAMILLTNLLCAVSIFYSIFTINYREKEYYFFILLLQTGILGTFLALDLFLFYIFWEIMLIPLYFLIGIWGSKNRVYATIKFVLYTLTGSVLMLLAIVALRFESGTFNVVQIREMIEDGRLVIPPGHQLWLFLGFFLAFAIKVPLFPFHTWLPDAHTEAPTAGSVILAGVLLKTGAYGIIRFCIPLFPEAAVSLAPIIAAMGTIAIIYGAFTAIAQTDLKRLIAYSSVSHMGFVILGLFAFNQQGITGAIMQMINHGLSTGGLFLMVGMIYERRHTRNLSEFGGLGHNLKIYAVLSMFLVLSSVGLPGLNGFVGEFLILLGAFGVYKVLTIIAASGVILAAVYLLTMYQKVFLGPLDKIENKGLKDLRFWEVCTLLPLIVFIIWIGVYPRPFLNAFTPNTSQIVRIVSDYTPPTPQLPVYVKTVDQEKPRH